MKKSLICAALMILGLTSFSMAEDFKAPKRRAFSDINIMALQAIQWNDPQSIPSMPLKIKIEPPIASGLIMDQANSYIQKVSVETAPFPRLSRDVVYLDGKGNYLELDELVDQTPYMGHFWFVDQGLNQLSILKDSYSNPYYFVRSQEVVKGFQLNINSDELYELKFSWFDANNDQFYQEHLMFNAYKIAQKIYKNMPNETFDYLMISINDGGTYTLWLGNDVLEVQIAHQYRAQTINYDWNTFSLTLPDELQKLTRQEIHEQQVQLTKLPYLDEKFNLKDQNGKPIPNFKYRVQREDGKNYCGVTNLNGDTKRINTGNIAYTLQLFDGKRCPIIDKD